MMWEGRHVKRTSFVDPSWFESSGKLIINDMKCTLKKTHNKTFLFPLGRF